jgi:acetylornithine/N-succinyldiaminopimelate aminotransferase
MPPSSLLPVYRRSALVMVRGDGCFLYDETDKEYLDCAAGIATNALGHNHPAMLEALGNQAQLLWHCSNMYRNPALEAFADALIAASPPASKVFFCSSGSEAVETAIKTIRRYHHVRGDTQRTEILVVDGGFHGRTTGALAACSNPASKLGYAPLMQGFRTLPFHDAEALEAAFSSRTAAILLEPIQGEGGVRVHDAHYLQQVRRLCSAHGALLCLDEGAREACMPSSRQALRLIYGRLRKASAGDSLLQPCLRPMMPHQA